MAGPIDVEGQDGIIRSRSGVQVIEARSVGLQTCHDLLRRYHWVILAGNPKAIRSSSQPTS